MKRVGMVAAGIATAWVIASVLGGAAALGPARLARGDVSLVSVAASLAALACLGALGWLVVTARRGWPCRIVLAILLLAFTAIAALPVGIAVWATHPAHAELSGAAPEGALDRDIPCTHGATLAGWYLPGESGAGVVLAHGAGSTRSATVTQARVLHDAGFAVLMVDARGHGDSTGAAMDLGWWGEEDLACALDALASEPGVDPTRMGLVGLSMGGEQAIGAAGADPRVRAVVAEGATQRIAADKAGWLPGGLGGWLQRRMDAERDLLVGLLTDAPTPPSLRDAALATDAPILLVVAGNVSDESRAAAWIAEGNPRVETLLIDGAPHTGGLATDPALWTETVIGFLERALA